ncbi:MAG: VOC family protein [Myxococcota bacterium]
MTTPTLTPRLVVEGADRAIAFYSDVFSAELIERYADGEHVVHAALRIGDAIFSLTEAHPKFNNHAPTQVGGASSMLTLLVDDPDAVAARMVAAGGEVIFPIADQFYGHREGRVRDPFGHLWILSKILEELSPDEIQARMGG